MLGQWLEEKLLKNATFHQLTPSSGQGLRFLLMYEEGNTFVERVELRPYEFHRPLIHTPGQIIVDADYAVSNLDTIKLRNF